MDQVAEHTDTDSTTWELQVVRVDPRELLTDRNIRTDARLTKEFVADIRERGVRVPIVATATATGDGLRVWLGHRRTLAAIEAGLVTAPSSSNTTTAATGKRARWAESSISSRRTSTGPG